MAWGEWKMSNSTAAVVSPGALSQTIWYILKRYKRYSEKNWFFFEKVSYCVCLETCEGPADTGLKRKVKISGALFYESVLNIYSFWAQHTHKRQWKTCISISQTAYLEHLLHWIAWQQNVQKRPIWSLLLLYFSILRLLRSVCSPQRLFTIRSIQRPIASHSFMIIIFNIINK